MPEQTRTRPLQARGDEGCGQDGFQGGFASVGEPEVGRWFGEMAAWVQAKRSRIFFLKRGQSSPVRRSQMAGLPLMRNRAPRQW